MSSSRRSFLANSSKALLAAGIGVQTKNTVQKISAADKITVALIGAGGMGMVDLRDALKQPGVECAAVCDVDENVLRQRIAEISKIQGSAPKGYSDFRQLLENKDIDAVMIGTPDHWHCLPMIYACQAGKDVYVEKPIGNSIAECDLMVKAARKYNRVVQVGQQQRSGEHWRSAIEFIKAGKIGQLRKVQIWANFNYGIGQPVKPDGPVPAGVDFDRWLGPAPVRTFNPSRFHGSWRMFWDYGGGLMTDWGVHLLDMALWGADITTAPISVVAAGGNFSYPDFAHETFDTMSVVYQLPKINITWEHTAGTQKGPFGRNYGLAFIGNDATLVIDRDTWDILPETENGNYKVPVIPTRRSTDQHETHVKNWFDCIRSRKDPNCTIENGRLVALYAQMGNIAARTNTRLEWNNANNNFGNNAAANALITPVYRKPWVLPVL